MAYCTRHAGSHRRRPPWAEAGFTLIELMAATAIFLSGMTAVLTAQLSAQRTNAIAAHLSTAGMLANNFLEHMRLLPSSSYNLFSGSGMAVSYGLDGSLSGGGQGNNARPFYNLVGKVTITGTQEAELAVNITWTEPATQQTKTIEFATKAPL